MTEVNIQSDKPKETATRETKEDGPADFEKAIEATGFGAFNLLLLIVATSAQFASMFESSTMSYILPIAECDLKLTLFNKGVLNAVTYAGMIISAIFWGYIADTKGRQKVLAYGYLLDAVCVVGSALSQNFEMLVVFKFFGGFIVNGPGAVLFTYLCELHGIKHRPRVIMILGVITSSGLLLLPLMAWGIFPRYWDFVLFGVLNVHAWQIFLLVCALPSIIAGAIFLMLPESPKFLMSQGRNTEALRVFQRIYAINMREPRDTYPIKQLIEEVPSRESNGNEVIYTIEGKPDVVKSRPAPRSFIESLRAGMQQIKPMFHKPLLGRSIHCYLMQFCILLGLNTIRLWLPQLFASISEYETLHRDDNEGSANLCTILEFTRNKTTSIVNNYDSDPNCMASKNISVDMYTNNIIVAVSGLVGYIFAGAIVRAIGAKCMLTLGLLISAVFGISLYWSTSGLTTVIISSTFVTITSISTSSLMGVVVALFPTQLRTLIVASTMMFGRLGALSGNILFPILMEIGCIPPFLMVSLVMFCAGGLSILLPNPKKVTFR